MPIIKSTVDRAEAIKYFNSKNDKAKAGVMTYNTNSYITLYRLGNYYNYFYNLMPTSTGKLKDFDITYIKENGFVLQFPTIYIPEKYHHTNIIRICSRYFKNVVIGQRL